MNQSEAKSLLIDYRDVWPSWRPDIQTLAGHWANALAELTRADAARAIDAYAAGTDGKYPPNPAQLLAAFAKLSGGRTHKTHRRYGCDTCRNGWITGAPITQTVSSPNGKPPTEASYDTVLPCPDCAPEAYARWSDGHYASDPLPGHTPTRHDEPAPVEVVYDEIDKARTLIAAAPHTVNTARSATPEFENLPPLTQQPTTEAIS